MIVWNDILTYKLRYIVTIYTFSYILFGLCTFFLFIWKWFVFLKKWRQKKQFRVFFTLKIKKNWVNEIPSTSNNFCSSEVYDHNTYSNSFANYPASSYQYLIDWVFTPLLPYWVGNAAKVFDNTEKISLELKIVGNS